MKKKVVGYARISTEDQSHFSIPHQIEQINTYCEKNGHELLKVFTDEGQSAKNFERKSWKQLAKFLQENKDEIDYLVVLKYDRFSRNLKEALSVIQQLEEVYKIKLISISEPIGLPPESPFYFQLRTNMLLYAHSERLMIRDRTLTGMRRARKEGHYLSKAPYGYRNTRDEKNKTALEVIATEAEVVRHIYNWYLQGYSIGAIKSKAAQIGFPQKGNTAMQRILTNKLYCGLVKASFKSEKAEFVPGNHEPIVDEETFWKVQHHLNRPKPRANENEKAYLKQAILCAVPGCGRPMTCSRSKGRNKYYWYYECTTHRKGNSVDVANKKFESILDELTFTGEQIQYLESIVRKNITAHIKENFGKLPQLTNDKTKILQKIDNLEEKYLSGNFDDEAFARWRMKLKKDLEALTTQIEFIQKNENKYWNAIIKKFDNLSTIKDVFSSADLQQKRNFIEIGFGRGLTWDGSVYRTAYLNPVFMSKMLVLRRKRLLEYEPKKGEFKNSPLGTPGGT